MVIVNRKERLVDGDAFSFLIRGDRRKRSWPLIGIKIVVYAFRPCDLILGQELINRSANKQLINAQLTLLRCLLHE